MNRYEAAKAKHAAALRTYQAAIRHGTTMDMERALDASDAAYVALCNASREHLSQLNRSVRVYVARAA